MNNSAETAQWGVRHQLTTGNDMYKNKKPILTVIRMIAMFWICLSISACNGSSEPSPGRTETTQAPLQSGKKELAIVGYNYTAKHINSFDVGPVGGGNVHLSSETGGGGGIVCCFPFQRDVGPRTVDVEWTDSICKYNVATHSNGATTFTIHRELRKSSVEIATPVPRDLQYLEIHFYPDGTVQAAITATISPPRIVLSKSRGKPLPICINNSKPG